jgi:hypothetical protein
MDRAGDVTGSADPRDRVMWLFALIAGILMVLAVVLVGLLAIFRPDADTGELAKAVSTQLSLIVGAVLGYAARGPGAAPTPPPSPTPPPTEGPPG